MTGETASGADGTAPGETSPQGRPPRVVLYSKPGCHLCDDAREVIAEVCGERGERFAEVDITSSEELMRRFGEQIPVTLVDGEQHDFWRVDAARLRTALA